MNKNDLYIKLNSLLNFSNGFTYTKTTLKYKCQSQWLKIFTCTLLDEIFNFRSIHVTIVRE